MKSQHFFIFYYFTLVFGIFYVKFFSLLRNERNSVDFSRLKDYKSYEPTVFKNPYNVYYRPNSPLTRDISNKLNEFLSLNGLTSSVLDLGSNPLDFEADDFTHYSFEDRTRLETDFKVVVDYEDSRNDRTFTLRIKGGSTLVFTVYSTTSYSEELCERMFSLVKRLFFDTSRITVRELKPVLDVNFVLMSDEGRVSWNFSEKVLFPYVNLVLSSLSLFYDLNLHSRVVSNANFFKKFYMNSPKEEPRHGSLVLSPAEVELDLNSQDSNFYNFFEALSNVDVSLRDQHSFRHSLNFFAILPSKPTFVLDPFTKHRRETFTIDNLGIFTFLNNRINQVQPDTPPNSGHNSPNTYELTEKDILDLVSTWVTHLRHLHHLPATKSEYVFFLSHPNEKVKILSENSFTVSTTSHSFQLIFDNPASLAFYSFELHKLASVYHRSYLRATLKNLEKFPDLSWVSYNTQVPKSTVEFIKKSLRSLDLALYSPDSSSGSREPLDPVLDSLDPNQRSLALVRLAFLQSLEALSDDAMFNRNVLSYEHQLAVFMCDVFPYLFPPLSFLLGQVFQKLKSLKSPSSR